MTEDAKQPAEPVVMPWVEFLQDQPPGPTVTVADAAKPHMQKSHILYMPDLKLHCPEPTCAAPMFFQAVTDDDIWLYQDKWKYAFIVYRCRNCQRYFKEFALSVALLDSGLCLAYKFGERPAFGPPVPARVLTLIGPDRDLFLSGRRCENQGLGVGAFAYYRRVVENQWGRLVDEVIRVARRMKAPAQTISALETVKHEQQFSKAVDEVKAAIPESLLVDGHNPLMLLHSALSQGVHNLPDAECLELAVTIRLVLVELAEKLGEALRSEKEVSNAISRLLHVHASKKTASATEDTREEATL